MGIDLNNPDTFLNIITWGLSSYLFIFSVLLLIGQRSQYGLRWFSVVGLSLAIVLATSLMTGVRLSFEVSSLLIWPALYLYTAAQKLKRPYSIHFLHFLIPLIWIGIYLTINSTIKAGLYEVIQLLVMIIYIWLSLAEIQRGISFNKEVRQNSKVHLITMFYGLIAIMVFRLLLAVFNIPEELTIQLFYLFLGLYWVVLTAFLINPTHETNESLESEERVNYEEMLKRKLNKLMLSDQVFLDPELTLQKLASMMDLKLNELSSFINTHLEKNFNDYINEYRVKEFKRLVRSPDTDAKSTIMELAYQSGFNSKASFNRLFKEYMGVTPTQFKKGETADKQNN